MCIYIYIYVCMEIGFSRFATLAEANGLVSKCRTLQHDRSSKIPMKPPTYPCGLHRSSFSCKVIPKRNYYGAYGQGHQGILNKGRALEVLRRISFQGTVDLGRHQTLH